MKKVHLVNLLEDGELTRVKLVNYSYYSGDSRSHGSLSVTAETDAGELQLEGSLGSSGELEDLEVTLGGVKCSDDDLNGFDPGTPHYYSGARAVRTWEESAEKTLQDALEEWLGL